MHRSTCGAPLGADERERLRALVRYHGETRAAERLGVSRHALARALGELPVHRGTAALIRAGLEAHALRAERSP